MRKGVIKMAEQLKGCNIPDNYIEWFTGLTYPLNTMKKIQYFMEYFVYHTSAVNGKDKPKLPALREIKKFTEKYVGTLIYDCKIFELRKQIDLSVYKSYVEKYYPIIKQYQNQRTWVSLHHFNDVLQKLMLHKVVPSLVDKMMDNIYTEDIEGNQVYIPDFLYNPNPSNKKTREKAEVFLKVIDEDLEKNKENSLYAYLITHNQKMCVTEIMALDWQNHIDNLKEYILSAVESNDNGVLKISSNYIGNTLSSNTSIFNKCLDDVSYIKECKDIHYDHNGISYYFETHDPLCDALKELLDANNNETGVVAGVEKPFFITEVIRHLNGMININIKRSAYTKITNEMISEGSTRKYDIFIDQDSRMYIKGTHKYLPVTMKDIYQLTENPIFLEILEKYAEMSNNLLIKDIIKDCKEASACIIPITMTELTQYHNKEEFLKSHYKNAGALRVKYNKININLSYMIIKAMTYVDISSLGYLQNIRDIRLLKNVLGCKNHSVKNAVTIFITNYYTHERNIDNNDIPVDDYVRMCIQSGRKLHLNYSANRIQQEHNNFMEHADYYEYLSRTEAFKIPQDSKFNPVDEQLPVEFERIRNRNRLIKESMIMHHCVWSYGYYLKNDISAIYSFKYVYNDEEKRYTVEVKKNKKGFFINQIQSKYDRGCPQEVRAYVNRFIKAANNAK